MQDGRKHHPDMESPKSTPAVPPLKREIEDYKFNDVGKFEAGDRVAEIEQSFKRNVSWREVAERLGDRWFGRGRGDGYCEKVLRSTKPTCVTNLLVR